MSKIINDFLSFTLSSAFAGFVLIAVLADQKRDGLHHSDQVIAKNVYEYMPPQPCGTITDVTVTKVATIVNQTGPGSNWGFYFSGCILGTLADRLSASDACAIVSNPAQSPMFVLPSNLLTLTGFGFTIPSGADIKGITLVMNRRDSTTSYNVRDSVIRLVNAATGIPDDKKSPAIWPGLGSSDLWRS
jgi:hypothetical protein